MRRDMKWQKKWKRCVASTKNNHRCKGKALPGREYCLAHTRSQKIKHAKDAGSPKAGHIENGLFPEEVASFRELVLEWERVTTKPHLPADTQAIERIAMCAIQLRRCDVAAKNGDKSAGKNAYFAGLALQNWIKTLAADRRFKAKLQGGSAERTAEILKKFGWLFKGGTKVLELDRGNGQTAADEPGLDKGRSGGVLLRDASHETPPQTDNVPEGEEPV